MKASTGKATLATHAGDRSLWPGQGTPSPRTVQVGRAGLGRPGSIEACLVEAGRKSPGTAGLGSASRAHPGVQSTASCAQEKARRPCLQVTAPGSAHPAHTSESRTRSARLCWSRSRGRPMGTPLGGGQGTSSLEPVTACGSAHQSGLGDTDDIVA